MKDPVSGNAEFDVDLGWSLDASDDASADWPTASPTAQPAKAERRTAGPSLPHMEIELRALAEALQAATDLIGFTTKRLHLLLERIAAGSGPPTWREGMEHPHPVFRSSDINL
jgi:hypothetical protein